MDMNCRYVFVKFGDMPGDYICVSHPMGSNWILIQTKTMRKIYVKPYDKHIHVLSDYEPTEDDMLILNTIKNLYH